MSMPKGLILAAGRGSRMGTLTEEMPKGLAPLAGRSLIAWQEAALARAGIEPVALVTGYQAERLAKKGRTCFHNPRWASTNMVMSLAAADEWMAEGDTIVSYSDIVYHPDIPAALAAAEGDIAITYDRDWAALWDLRFDRPLLDAESFECRDGRLVDIGRRVRCKGAVGGQYMGLVKFSAAGWGLVSYLLGGMMPEVRDRLDMTALLRELLALGQPIVTVPVDGRWLEVDSGEDLAAYEARLKQKAAWSHDWRWKTQGVGAAASLEATTAG
ncbi:phosphocholine cytidylyltransferase family protein [Oceanibacterium hippocampi]|uniref:Bifunctional protein GlmU n=1 Tax=Oceanibacterium hippocampi TaxID=745714 RepID=A0A1Y5SI91_9PROT|nr:phosphocholine cytidylyltransferase family protein [Oceanibacterium hippocampi]SLN38447.1 Bifunctional protein GlmU [Oceanibacterium hippocampi]